MVKGTVAIDVPRKQQASASDASRWSSPSRL
jgi:hypothetical protein